MGAAGDLGQWLWKRFTGPHPDWVRIGGVWPLGDSLPVLVTALDVESSSFETISNGDGATRRTYIHVDLRLLVGDLLAKLRAHDLHNKEAS
jgi:purine nucleosidase